MASARISQVVVTRLHDFTWKIVRMSDKRTEEVIYCPTDAGAIEALLKLTHFNTWATHSCPAHQPHAQVKAVA